MRQVRTAIRTAVGDDEAAVSSLFQNVKAQRDD